MQFMVILLSHAFCQAFLSHFFVKLFSRFFVKLFCHTFLSHFFCYSFMSHFLSHFLSHFTVTFFSLSLQKFCLCFKTQEKVLLYYYISFLCHFMQQKLCLAIDKYQAHLLHSLKRNKSKIIIF